MREHQVLLRELGEALPEGRFVSRELDLRRERDAACVAAQFGGAERIRQRYPELHTLFQHSCQTPRDLSAASSIGFQDKAKVLAVGYDAASGTVYATGTMTLTAPAQRLYLSLDVYADGALVAHNARFYSGCPDGDIQIQSAPMPPLENGKEYTAYLQATWEPGKSGLLRAQVAKDTASAGAADPVKSITVTNPRHIRSPKDGAITVAYSRNAPNMDYCYAETRDASGDERVMLEMTGQVDLIDGYHVSEVLGSQAGAVLACQGFGDILYLGSLAYGQSPSAGAVFFPVNGGAGIGWKLDLSWNNSIPDSVRFGNRTHDLEFSFNFRCQEDRSLHNVLITSKGPELVLSQPHVEKVSKIHLYWGCLAKGTRVTMANGAAKSIEDLKPGDSLKTPGGGTARVKSLISGTEQNLYRVHLANGLEVRASRTHPLGAGSGFTAPIDLASHSRLMTAQGLSDVLYCFPETYNGPVYGVELESGDSFFADGVVSGTNAVMGALADQWADELLTLEPDRAAAEERARLEADLRAGLL